MSAGINENNRLYEYLEGLYKGIKTRDWFDEYEDDLNSATPWSVNAAIDILISSFDDYNKIETSVARFIRAASKSLDRAEPLDLPEDHFLAVLMKENRALDKIRNDMALHFKKFCSLTMVDPIDENTNRALMGDLMILQDIRSHYLKIQYGLFTAFEEASEHFRCVKLMWHIQNCIQENLKSLIDLLTGLSDWDREAFNKIFGEMYLKMGALRYREENILFPVVYRAVSAEKFEQMKQELIEYGTAFSVQAEGTPEGFALKKTVPPEIISGAEVDLSVGKLLPRQIDLMLKNLPFDITYMDENDRVRYYSQGKERIFPRSPGIIGRDVQNCHPPESVHIVQEIIEDFKSRKRSEAEFWIPMGEKFVHIRYFPLFEEDSYRGGNRSQPGYRPFKSPGGRKKTAGRLKGTNKAPAAVEQGLIYVLVSQSCNNHSKPCPSQRTC